LLQQTPRDVTGEPPSLEISPPPEADVAEIKLTEAVVITGGSALSLLHEGRINVNISKAQNNKTVFFFMLELYFAIIKNILLINTL
jgi:hypothetical protein